MKSDLLPPLESYFGAERSSFKRPILTHSPSKERSFYQGVFAKGTFEAFPKPTKEITTGSPQASPLLSPLSSPKLFKMASKQSSTVNNSFQNTTSFYGAATNSYNNSRTLEVDPEIVHGYKNELIMRNPPKKLQKLLEITNPTKSIATISPKREKKEKEEESLTIGSYLGFLGANPTENVSNFSKKMHYKAGTTKVTTEITESETTRPEDQLTEMLTLHKKSSSYASPTLRTAGTFVLEESFSPVMSRKESLALAMEESEASQMSRNTLTKHPSAPAKNISIILTDGKSDETLAKELTEEVVNNYKIYMQTAAKTQELHAKMTRFLKEHEVLEIFTGRLNKYMPLPQRIFRDMTELADDQGTQLDKVRSEGDSQLSPQLKPVKAKKGRPQARLLPAKYQLYKTVSREFEKVTSQFRMQGLHALEGKLLQSHEEFKQRKNDVLRSLSKWNTKKFENLKSDCESVEDMLFLYEKYDLKDKLQLANKINKETKTINNSLNGFMRNWKKTLTNVAIAEEEH